MTINPGDNIQAAVNANPTGTTFNVKAGLYRMQSVTPKDWDVFIGEPGTIMNGALALTNFVQQGNLWVATATVPEGQWIDYGTYPVGKARRILTIYSTTTSRFSTCFRKGKSRPAHGTSFMVSRERSMSPTIPLVRLLRSVSPVLHSQGSASNVTIQGFVVEKYAIPGQFGAIGDQYQGANWLIQGNEARLNHGTGISGANGSRIIGNYVHHNGMKGLGGAALGPGIPEVGILVEGNEMSFNSTMHFWYDGESGGAKFAAVNGLTMSE